MPERLQAVERTTLAAFRFRSRLEGTTFRFFCSFNTRGDFWTLDIASADGDQLVAGYKLTAGEDILQQLADARLPPGTLVVVDTTGGDLDPRRTDLGDGVRLVYTTEAEVAAGG